MVDILLLVGALIGIAVLGARWNFSSSGGGGREERGSDEDTRVLEELRATGRFRIDSCTPREPERGAEFTAAEFHRLQAEVRLFQARLQGEDGAKISPEQARLKTALAGLMDQLEDLSRLSDDPAGDRRRLARIRSQVHELDILFRQRSLPPPTLEA